MSGKDERASNVKSIRKALGKLTHSIRNSSDDGFVDGGESSNDGSARRAREVRRAPIAKL
jgi:hypothetical protein